MKIINLFTLSLLFFLTACSQQKQNNTDVSKQKIEAKKVDTEKAVSEVEIPVTVEVSKEDEQKLKYPKEVIEAVDSSRFDCGSNDKIEDYAKYIKAVHFRNKNLTDYVIYPAEIMCGLANSMYGNGGTEVYIYSTLADGKTKETFGNRLYDAKIVENNHKQELHLKLGGGYCGQDMEITTKAEVIACWRVVEWNDKKQEFELGKMYMDDENKSEQ